MDYPLSLYFHTEPAEVKVLDLCRGEDDYRKVYIADDGTQKLVIKHVSNTFSDAARIQGWLALTEEYRKIGLYCPAAVPNLHGETVHEHTEGGRAYVVYAEEFSKYQIAENVAKEHRKDQNDEDTFAPDMLRALGKIASAHLDILTWPSAYCLLEPFCAPDTTDEATECAESFVSYVEKHARQHLPRAKRLLELFYGNQRALRAVYGQLPTSCFQADLNDSNVLLDGDYRFVGLIDFNLCGREPVLNYAVREALWNICDRRLYGENDSRLYFYDRVQDDLRISLFLKNMGYIQEFYTFDDTEREIFPILFRYVNSFWWFHLNEIKMAGQDDQRITQILDWLERQMTRDDVRLPQ